MFNREVRYHFREIFLARMTITTFSRKTTFLALIGVGFSKLPIRLSIRLSKVLLPSEQLSVYKEFSSKMMFTSRSPLQEFILLKNFCMN